MQFEFFLTLALGFVVIAMLFLCCNCMNTAQKEFSNQSSQYKWGVPSQSLEKESSKREVKPPDPIHIPIIKSDFGLDLDTRWLPLIEETIHFDRDPDILIPEVHLELRQHGFFIPDNELLELNQSTHKIIAGGKVAKTGTKIVITLKFDSMIESTGSIVEIQVYCKDRNTGRLLLEKVKQLLWQ